MSVGLLSKRVFSPFGELWLAESYGGGITSGMSIGIGIVIFSCYGNSYIEIAVGHSELGAASLLKAVWWDLRLASLLTHLFKIWGSRPSLCTVTEVEGLRQRGHLRKTWWDGVKDDIKSFGLSQEDEQDLNKGKGSRICIALYFKLLISKALRYGTC